MKDEDLKNLIHTAHEIEQDITKMVDESVAKGQKEPPAPGTRELAVFSAAIGSFLMLMGKITLELLRRNLNSFPEMKELQLRSVGMGLLIGGMDIHRSMGLPKEEQEQMIGMAKSLLNVLGKAQEALAKPAMDAAQAHMDEIVDKIFMEGGPIHEA